ncbi:extracellular solute-binding protein [Streptomyces sp. NPDC004752]
MLLPNYTAVTAPVQAALKAVTGLSGVQLELASGSGWPDVDNRFQQDVTAGRVPDIVMVGINMLGYYHTNKIAQPLDELLPSAGLDVNSFDPAIMTSGRIDGQLVGTPWGVSTMTLYYNKDIFAKAGLDPEQPPKTFSQLRQFSEQIVSSHAARYGVSTSLIQSSGNWVFQNYLLSNGGSTMSPDGKRIAFNDPAGVQMLKYWADLAADKLSMPGTLQQIDDALARRDLAMVLNPSSVRSLISTSMGSSLAAAAMPIPDGGQAKTLPGGGALIIVTKDKARQQAAAKAVAALLSERAQRLMVTTTGYLPVNSSAARKAASSPLVAPSVAQLKTLVPWQNFPGNNSNQINKLLNDAITAALLGKKSPQAALDDAAKAGAALLPA